MRILPFLALLGVLATAVLSACAPSPASTSQADAAQISALSEPDVHTPYFINLNTIVPIVCYVLPPDLSVDQIDKMTDAQFKQIVVKSGTGTIIAHNRILTAEHVIAGNTMCGIAGRIPVTITYQSHDNDIAVLDANLGSTPVSTISCDPYVKGKPYLMFGFAGGKDFALDYGEFSGIYMDGNISGAGPKEGTRVMKHLAVFPGATTPGMSGGPVFDLSGRIVGINNATSPSFAMSRQLADTALCTALKPAPTAP